MITDRLVASGMCQAALHFIDEHTTTSVYSVSPPRRHLDASRWAFI